MSAEQPIPKTIADEAARWFADRDSGLLEDEWELAAWLAADPRHARAFAEMEAVWADLGGVQAALDVRASLTPPRYSHRRLSWRRQRPGKPRRWVPVAVAASLAMLVVGAVQDWPTRLQSDAMTATGERRTVGLPDGSRVQLNTASAIAFDYRADRRVIRLLKGEALFTVAADPSRPFTVEAGGGSTTALGTRFLVRDLGESTRVTVTEHSVRVAYPEGQTAQTRIREGQSLLYGPGRGLGTAMPVNAGDAEAWTQGVLVFENRPLSEVVAELGRYHPGYVRLIGADMQSRRVSGVFSIDDPVSSFAKLQRSLGLRSIQITDRLIVIFR
ncbi:FecR family protein [Sphingobium sp. YR768]|uniref:FecR family protein n=1 Tax=Sphingobium sp. YR768 TaxID=1884365 RepID=UPI0008D58DCA|nr:FecR family protein [Sphingobium sp. YR768]SES12074.1 FecR family protein [Sphingobium sp. YR768]